MRPDFDASQWSKGPGGFGRADTRWGHVGSRLDDERSLAAADVRSVHGPSAAPAPQDLSRRWGGGVRERRARRDPAGSDGRLHVRAARRRAARALHAGHEHARGPRAPGARRSVHRRRTSSMSWRSSGRRSAMTSSLPIGVRGGRGVRRGRWRPGSRRLSVRESSGSAMWRFASAISPRHARFYGETLGLARMGRTAPKHDRLPRRVAAAHHASSPGLTGSRRRASVASRVRDAGREESGRLPDRARPPGSSSRQIAVKKRRSACSIPTVTRSSSCRPRGRRRHRGRDRRGAFRTRAPRGPHDSRRAGERTRSIKRRAWLLGNLARRPPEGVTQWVNMRVPDGTEYLEVHADRVAAGSRQRGMLHHVALLVSDIQTAWDEATQTNSPNRRARRCRRRTSVSTADGNSICMIRTARGLSSWSRSAFGDSSRRSLCTPREHSAFSSRSHSRSSG